MLILKCKDPVIKGKTWRSLDLANQSHSNVYPQYPPTTNATTATSTNTSIHHNSLINNVPIHYQRHDFKNRRSSSEPANEQKLLAHIQNSHNNTTINPNTKTNNTSSLVIDDPSSIVNPGDDFIDCLHQKNIKVSKRKIYTKDNETLFKICSLSLSSLTFTLSLLSYLFSFLKTCLVVFFSFYYRYEAFLRIYLYRLTRIKTHLEI